MPYKSEKIKIEGTKLDRRIKLTEAQREEIKANIAGLSQRKLAKLYGVSRRTITFILDPEKQKRNFELRQMRGGSKQYYDKDKQKDYIKDHRHYKHDLYKQGKIKSDEK